MAATLAVPRSVPLKPIAFTLLVLLAILVFATRDIQLLSAASPLRHHYVGIGPLMIVHGVFGALALLIAPFQFSSRIRNRFIKVHRFMGRTYVLSVLVASLAAVPAAIILGPPELIMAASTQATGWTLTTLTALYCVRTGRIQQHREWMMRSYPFAVVFIVVRSFLAVPWIAHMGIFGLIVVVWSVIAAACFLPSFLIALNATLKARPAPLRAAS
jgi:uncharacterized membrane protein